VRKPLKNEGINKYGYSGYFPQEFGVPLALHQASWGCCAPKQRTRGLLNGNQSGRDFLGSCGKVGQAACVTAR
jgi:hypothetical protein